MSETTVLQRYTLTVKKGSHGFSSSTVFFLDLPAGSTCREVYEAGLAYPRPKDTVGIPPLDQVSFYRGQAEYHSPMIFGRDEEAPAFLLAKAD